MCCVHAQTRRMRDHLSSFVPMYHSAYTSLTCPLHHSGCCEALRVDRWRNVDSICSEVRLWQPYQGHPQKQSQRHSRGHHWWTLWPQRWWLIAHLPLQVPDTGIVKSHLCKKQSFLPYCLFVCCPCVCEQWSQCWCERHRYWRHVWPDWGEWDS